LAWSYALSKAAKLKSEYDHAEEKHPTIHEKYPATAAFFGGRKDIAARGVATRADNKKKKTPAK
jgi:hypothetical protein